MKCSKTERWLSAEADGELSASKRARLEAHLSDCASCREAREQLTRLSAHMPDEWPTPGAKTPEAAWNDIRRELRTGDAPVVAPSTAAWTPRWVLAAAAVLLIGVGLWWGVGPPSDDPGMRLAAADVELLESDLPDTSLMVYKDPDTDWLIIWVAGDDGDATDHDRS